MTSRLILVLSLLCVAAARADEPFTKALSPEDFAAAGLGKLSPEELARLDALVAGKQSGAVAKATEDTTKKVAATVREQVKAEARHSGRDMVTVLKELTEERSHRRASGLTID